MISKQLRRIVVGSSFSSLVNNICASRTPREKTFPFPIHSTTFIIRSIQVKFCVAHRVETFAVVVTIMMLIKAARTNFTPLLFLILLAVGPFWTEAMGQQQQQQNNMSFTSSSYPSPFLSSSLMETGQDETTTEGEYHQQPILQRGSGTGRRMQSSNSRIPTNKNSERDLITTKIRLLPKDKLNRYKMEAARQLQASLIRCFQVLSRPAEKLPANVRGAAKRALAATQAGNYNPAIVRHLPAILRQGAQQQGHPGNQLQVILTNIIPSTPPATQGALKGLLGFVSANLSGVNTLLGKVLGGVPDLLSGVINSLTMNLSAVTGTLNGTLASLGDLLGGLLG